MKIDSQLIHDFNNQTVRMEIIMKMICQELSEKKIQKESLLLFEDNLQLTQNLYEKIKNCLE
jgi:hypothetical protein